MSDGKKIGITAVVLLVIALLFWNPITRSVIMFILPLGTGLDDLIFIAALLGAVVFGVMWYARKKLA